VFDHVFSILLDRIRQRRAVEAVAALIPKSARLTASAETEYVLLVRGKAIFWFSGAAAKRTAGRRLLLEHARDLAEAEQAPFYVLNSRARKVRFAIIAAGLMILISAGFLFQPSAVDWARRLMRHSTVSTPQPDNVVDAGSDAQGPAFGADIDAGGDLTDALAKRSPEGRTASRHVSPASVSDAMPVEPDGVTTILQYEARMASFARAWPDLFDDPLMFASSYFEGQNEAPTSVSDQAIISQTPPSPTVFEKHAGVANPDNAHRAAVPDTSKQ
jgi:hypothetical protein